MSTERNIQVVTGGTSGMGLATAKAISKFGPVLIGGRNEKRLNHAMELLKGEGVEVYGKTCDASDMDSLKAFAEYAVSIAPIENVVNAAGVDHGDRIFQNNAGSVINVCRAMLPYMDHARLVNFSSVTGYFYPMSEGEQEVWDDPEAPDFMDKAIAILDEKGLIPRMEHLGREYVYYTASKRFTMYYTQMSAVRFGKKNCQIFSIAPGSFDTPMLRQTNTEEQIQMIANTSALGRIGQADEMAQLIASLLTPGHDYLTGCDIIMDGGMTAMNTVKQLPPL